jgi:hypothetical protein
MQAPAGVDGRDKHGHDAHQRLTKERWRRFQRKISLQSLYRKPERR